MLNNSQQNIQPFPDSHPAMAEILEKSPFKNGQTIYHPRHGACVVESLVFQTGYPFLPVAIRARSSSGQVKIAKIEGWSTSKSFVEINGHCLRKKQRGQI